MPKVAAGNATINRLQEKGLIGVNPDTKELYINIQQINAPSFIETVSLSDLINITEPGIKDLQKSLDPDKKRNAAREALEKAGIHGPVLDAMLAQLELPGTVPTVTTTPETGAVDYGKVYDEAAAANGTPVDAEERAAFIIAETEKDIKANDAALKELAENDKGTDEPAKGKRK